MWFSKVPSISFTKDSHVLLSSDTKVKRCNDNHAIYFSVVTVELKEESEAMDKMWQYIKEWSRSIEVVYNTQEQKKILTRVYFPFDPKVGWT